ncbi:hypothetical protein AAMO2058_001710900 [Amorphochlora amoebiformis]
MSELVQPATLSVVGLILGVQAVLAIKRVPLSSVGLNYLAVADRLQAWRMLTSALTHVDHIFCWRAGAYVFVNVVGLLCSAYLESQIGPVEYLKGLYLIMVLSNLLVLGMCYVIERSTTRARLTRLRVIREHIRSQWYICGMSSGVLGLLTAMMAHDDTIQIFGKQMLSFFPVIGYLPLAFLLAPRANLATNICGMPLGYMLGKGYFEWISRGFWFSLLFWTFVGFVINIKMRSRCHLPWIKIHTQHRWSDMNEVPVRTTILDGHVIFDERAMDRHARDVHNAPDDGPEAALVGAGNNMDEELALEGDLGAQEREGLMG